MVASEAACTGTQSLNAHVVYSNIRIMKKRIKLAFALFCHILSGSRAGRRAKSRISDATRSRRANALSAGMSSSPPPPPSPPTPPTSSAPPQIAAQDVPKLPVTPKPKSGIRAALEFTGIPPSLFEKKPKLPSRNWLIFIGVTSSIVGYYVYDRRECKRIRREYEERVRHFAEEKTGKFDLPRKVTVYGAKWPGDEDWDRSTRYFRKYLKACHICLVPCLQY